MGYGRVLLGGGDSRFRSTGAIRTDNLISNETSFAQVIPALRANAHGGAYLGVGPEQNFNYITALQPAVAFIIDIRRDNMLLHLMYKAVAETSADRGEFLSSLFGRPRPAGLDRETTAKSAVHRVQAGAGLHEGACRRKPPRDPHAARGRAQVHLERHGRGQYQERGGFVL